jgi:hypothetical protein
MQEFERMKGIVLAPRQHLRFVALGIHFKESAGAGETEFAHALVNGQNLRGQAFYGADSGATSKWREPISRNELDSALLPLMLI